MKLGGSSYNIDNPRLLILKRCFEVSALAVDIMYDIGKLVKLILAGLVYFLILFQAGAALPEFGFKITALGG